VNPLFDSFWRAAAYCLRPRVLLLSLLPLLIMATLAFTLGQFFWEPALAAVQTAFDSWTPLQTVLNWLQSIGLVKLKTMLAPLVVVALSTPLVVVTSLLMVAVLMTPAMIKLVVARRFAQLGRKQGGTFWGSVWRSVVCTLVALALLVLSIPLWFIPPMVLVLPPLIWGWLTYRVMTYDVLADHASAEERTKLVQKHRLSLLTMGVLTGYLGAAPSIVWASGALALILAPVLIPVAVWLYTLVFAFSALWFAHFALAALQALRAQANNAP
jgi:hypothetical protein